MKWARAMMVLGAASVAAGCADSGGGEGPSVLPGQGGAPSDFDGGAGGPPGAGGGGGLIIPAMGGAPGAGGQPGAGGEPGGGAGGQPGDDPWCDPESLERCNDDLDNNCDGLVDEGCTCTLPEKPCYSGDPADLLVPGAACREGVQACQLEFYGPCEGEVLPSAEVCDGIDNDCDGVVDQIPGCQNLPPRAICPPDQAGSPLANYDFQGGYEDPDGDPMARATWRMVEQPAGSTSEPTPADGLQTRIFADLQGTYVLELEVEDTNGGIGRCTTRLETSSEDRLRIELVWNVNAVGDASDVDLHLKRAPNAQWFDDDEAGDDCFFANCAICDDSGDEPGCRAQIAAYNNDPNRSPPPQVLWSAPLDDDDPRLDLDDVEGNGPENINIRRPRDGTYRLGIHYWDDDDFGPSTVTVKVFCGGQLARAFDPLVMQANGTSGSPSTEFWEVADIVWQGETCQVRELGAPGCRTICTRGEAEAGGCPPGLERGRPCP